MRQIIHGQAGLQDLLEELRSLDASSIAGVGGLAKTTFTEAYLGTYLWRGT